jgi:23S rRNA pseudouridine2605 synthase
MVDHRDEVEGDAPSGQAGAPGQGGERIAKALARAGVASRRDVERYIAEGRVRLNGRVLDSPAVKVGPSDILMVDDAVVSEPEGARLWRYHKPVGLITAHKDPGGRPTVFEHLPAGLPRVISVGRLDLNSEGLLLLTTDGALARALELPATGWVRRYRARAHGRTDQAQLDRLLDGVTVEGVRYGPIEARLDKAKEGATGSNLWITVSLTEGKNREVRRVLEHLGLKVNRLIRLAYGPFQLGTLAAGEVEEVGPRVIREQLADLMPGLKIAKSVGTAVLRSKPARRGAPVEPRPGAPEPAVGAREPSRRPRSAAAPSSPAEPEKVYKPGWAKPKKRVGPPRLKTAKPKSDRTLPDLMAAGAPRARAKGRPGKPVAPATGGATRRAPARPSTPKGGGPRPRG